MLYHARFQDNHCRQLRKESELSMTSMVRKYLTLGSVHEQLAAPPGDYALAQRRMQVRTIGLGGVGSVVVSAAYHRPCQPPCARAFRSEGARALGHGWSHGASRDGTRGSGSPKKSPPPSGRGKECSLPQMTMVVLDSIRVQQRSQFIREFSLSMPRLIGSVEK